MNPGKSRIMRFSSFEERARDTMHKNGYDDEVANLLLDWVQCVAFLKDDEVYVNVDDAKHYIQNWGMVLEHNDPQLLMQPRGLRVDKLVDVQEFVESREYLGQSGYVWKSTRDMLWEIFHGKSFHHYVEVVIAGAIGRGKTYTANLSLAYILYYLSCYHAPQVDFGLAPGSSIVFVMQSAKLTLARQVLFGEFGTLLRSSPYFKKVFPYNTKVLSELRFPLNLTILPVSSATTSALGMNVFSATLDEANFHKRVKGSKLSQFTGETNFDQAQKLYTTLERRMKSRFAKFGKIPGKFFLLSSANYPGDFTDRKMGAAKSDSTIFVSSLSLWEAKPAEEFSKEVFLVEVGDSAKQSRIIESEEQATDPSATILRVPEDWRKDFEDDIDAAIRDIAGIPVGARNQFIKQRDRLAQAFKRHEELYEGTQIFHTDNVDLSRCGDLRGLINQKFFSYLPADVSYAAHIDLALSGDSAGLAFSRLDGVKQLDKRMVWNESLRRYAEAPAGAVPIVSTDGFLRIDPPRGGEIDLEAITSLILLVHSVVPVRWLTADSFQSATMIQRTRKKRITSGRLSVDTNLAPYHEIKHAIRDGRWLVAPSEILSAELLGLIWDPAKQKIDHTAEGTKDLADAVAGSVYTIITRRSSYNEPAGERRRRSWVRGSSSGRARQREEMSEEDRANLRRSLSSRRRRVL